jgi:hypothetical protein
MVEPQGQAGETTRMHLQAAAAKGEQRARAALEPPSAPWDAMHIWEWFLELNAARPITAPATPLSYDAIAVWAHLTGRRLSRLELEWLKAVDRVWLQRVQRSE